MFNKKLFTYARKYSVLLIGTLVFGFLGGTAVILQAFGLSTVINAVFLEGKGLTELSTWLAGLLIIILTRGIISFLSNYLAKLLAIQIKSDLRNKIFAVIVNSDHLEINQESSGEIANTITEGIEALDAYFSQYLPQLFFSASIPLAILLVVFPVDLLSGIVLLLTAPLIPVFMVLIGRWADSLTKQRWKILSRLSAHFLDVLQGLTTLKQLGQSRKQLRSIKEFSDSFAITTLEVLRVAFLSAFVLELVSTLSTAVVAVEIGLRLLYGRIIFQEAFFILILAPEFYLPLRMLGTRFHAGIEGTAAAERIFALLAKINEFKLNNYKPADIEFQKFDFKAVSLQYQNREAPSVETINFAIKADEKVAFIGPSGGGKTSLMNVFLGLIKPDQGEVLLNGQALETYNPADWRNQIAWVPQQPHIFYDSLGNNLRYGSPETTDDLVWETLEWVELEHIIRELPDGLNTVVGEKGFRLSGGQRQRIALARAMLKPASILVWDEPSSSLDSGFEKILRNSLGTRFGGYTQWVIAHRISTILEIDRIIYMDKGKILAQGSHDQLLDSFKPYRDIYENYSDGVTNE